jgi:DNA-binding transcriptional MerR regulator
MSLTLQNLNNIRTLRAMARELSLDVLEEMLEKVRVVTEEKRSELAELEQQRAEQQEKINALLERMKADGISPICWVLNWRRRVSQRKSVSRVKQNIALLTRTVKRKRGPARAARRSLLPARWQTVNHWMIF